MVSVNEAFEVRLKKGNDNFEVLVDFDKLNEFKKDSNKISVFDVIADRKIFKDQKKGELASENQLRKIFPNKNEEEILKEILLNGECQIPTSYLNKLRETKKKQVINYIFENALNPQTKSKYSQIMIENEVNKLRYNFDPNINFINQANEVLKLLKKRMPISLEKIVLEIKIPGEYCGAFYGPFRQFGKILKEYFDKEGNLRLHIEIMESIQDNVINYIKKNSNNSAEYYVSKNN